MIKSEMLSSLKIVLKEKGFKKIRNYWYKFQNGMTFYLNIQGSNYCSNDYYVNLGITFSLFEGNIPPIYEWNIRRRIFVDGKEININIQDVLLILDAFLALFPNVTVASTFVQNQKKQYQHIIISNRYKLV